MNQDLLGVRVLFVNMPLRADAAPNTAPQGPALLAAILRERGAAVSIVDYNAYRVEGGFLPPVPAERLLVKHLRVHGEPHLVCLSGQITTLSWQIMASNLISRLCPHAFIASGGGLASHFGDRLLAWIPLLDAVCAGEGDLAVLDMAQDAASGSLRPLYAGQRPPDLDALPMPAWDILEHDVLGGTPLETYIKNPIWGLSARNSSATPFSMRRSLNTVSSRGCPFACHFCFRGATGGRDYAVRSAQSIAKEAEWLHDKYSLDFIGILDDNFMVRQDRLEGIAQEFAGLYKKGLRWGTHGRLDEAYPEAIRSMSSAGCVYIGYGAETASPKILEAMGKGGQMLSGGTVDLNGYQLPAKMIEGYTNTIMGGIHGNCTWMTGYPGETMADLRHSITFQEWQKDFIDDPAAVNTRFFIATAYPGTEMFRHPDVMARLEKGFGIKFDGDCEPIMDSALKRYCHQLGDASKLLTDMSGKLVNYSKIPDHAMVRARELAAAGRGAEVL